MANYHGFSLLDVCSKVYTAMLHQCMQFAMEVILGKSQMGFRSVHATINATWVFYNLIEWSITLQCPLFLYFVNLKEAYDNINREALWFAIAQ
jgi:hypothetical protein